MFPFNSKNIETTLKLKRQKFKKQENIIDIK